MREDSKKMAKIIEGCLDCFIEKGLTVTTTKDLCNALGLCNGAIYYYFETKEEIVISCAEEAINRIERRVLDIVLEDIDDIAYMMEHLGNLADEMSSTMRFLVSVCVSKEYGESVKPHLVKLANRYPYYANKIAEILGCDPIEVEPYVYLSILALNNYMIFSERALLNPQIESAKLGFMKLVQKYRKKK